MSLVSRLAGVLIAPLFVEDGLVAVRNPKNLAPRAEPVTTKLTEAVPMLPKETHTLVRINGGAQVAGGVLIGLGKFRRLGALILIASLVPTTLAGHAFWNEEDPGDQFAQRTQVWKNLAIMGGLLLVVFEPGRRSKAAKGRAAKVRVARETPKAPKAGARKPIAQKQGAVA